MEREAQPVVRPCRIEEVVLPAVQSAARDIEAMETRSVAVDEIEPSPVDALPAEEQLVGLSRPPEDECGRHPEIELLRPAAVGLDDRDDRQAAWLRAGGNHRPAG